MKRRSARDDDEPGHHRGEQAPDDDVEPRSAVLARGYSFFDDRCLQVKLHPRSDRRAHQPDDHRQVAVIPEADAGRLGHRRQRRSLPVGPRQYARDDVRDVKERG